jgi:hypothetical protein
MRLLLMSITTIMLYAFLLVAMLVGLLRYRRARSFRLWNMLNKQGWIWFALAVVAEVPTLVLVLFNINPSYNLLLQIPRVVIASIGTTYMFRALARYKSNARVGPVVDIIRLRAESNYMSSDVTPTSFPTSPPLSALSPPSSPLPPIPLSLLPTPLKVSVHTTTTTADYCDSEIQKTES